MMNRIISLKIKDYESIAAYALKNAPEESCGILAGKLSHGIKSVEKVYMLENTDHSPVHFMMDPMEQLKVIKDIRKNGLELIGNWHSHPTTEAYPSDEDQRFVQDADLSYLIYSLRDKELKSFHISEESVEEEQIFLST